MQTNVTANYPEVDKVILLHTILVYESKGLLARAYVIKHMAQ